MWQPTYFTPSPSRGGGGGNGPYRNRNTDRNFANNAVKGVKSSMKELEEKLAYEKARNDHMESFLQAKFPSEFEIFSVRKARMELETATSAASTPVPTWPFLPSSSSGAGDTSYTLAASRSLSSLQTQAFADPGQGALTAQLKKLTDLLESKHAGQPANSEAIADGDKKSTSSG